MLITDIGKPGGGVLDLVGVRGGDSFYFCPVKI